MHKAVNVDVDKVLEAIHQSRASQAQSSAIRIQEEQAYIKGLHKGLDIAEELLKNSNCKNNSEASFMDGVTSVIYELGKELDVKIQPVLDNLTSVDDACAIFADLIRKRLLES